MSTKGIRPWNYGTRKVYTDRNGLQWITVYEDGRRRGKKYSRYVMEQSIGRRLEPFEIVHHINENPSDNRIENLKIMKWGEHSIYHHNGKRHDAKSKITISVLAQYREELKHLRKVNETLRAAIAKAESR